MLENHVFIWRLEDVIGLAIVCAAVGGFLAWAAYAAISDAVHKFKKRKERKSGE